MATTFSCIVSPGDEEGSFHWEGRGASQSIEEAREMAGLIFARLCADKGVFVRRPPRTMESQDFESGVRTYSFSFRMTTTAKPGPVIKRAVDEGLVLSAINSKESL